jgi:hypothetical protein
MEPPLQIIATRLAFLDPLTGIAREFHSRRKLESLDFRD